VETAASMEQLTSTVKRNADNAHQASSLAQRSATAAREIETKAASSQAPLRRRLFRSADPFIET